MSDLRRLRLRVLATLGLPALGLPALGLPALGLAACGTSPTTPASDSPVVEVAPVAQLPAEPTPSEADDEPEDRAPTCSGDAYRDWLCGISLEEAKTSKTNPYATCPAESSAIRRRLAAPMSPPPLQGMELDAALTQRYRDHQAKQQDETKQLCCYSQCRPAAVAPEAEAIPYGFVDKVRCIGRVSHPSAPAEDNAECPAVVTFEDGPNGHYAAPYHDYSTRYYSGRETAVGATELCCYRSIRKRPKHRVPVVIPGRPLRDDQGRALGVTGKGTTWARVAELEHASVAAFAQLARGLVAAGAPGGLVAATHEAARDEILHAELARAEVGARGDGADIAPFPLAGEVPSLERMLRDTLRDGCLGEACAALVAREAAQQHEANATLHRIAGDEENHALLAWRVVAWILEVAPEHVTTARTILDELAAEVQGPPDDEGLWLDAATEHRLRQEAFAEVVAPCAAHLFDSLDAA